MWDSWGPSWGVPGESGGTGTLTGVFAPPSWILRQLLVNLGLAKTPDATITPWQGHTVMEPLTPDQVITVYDTSSVDHGRIMYTGERIEDRGCQIRVRSGIYSNDGYEKARTIAVTLDRRVRRLVVTIYGVVYVVHAVNRKSDVIALGEDTPNSRRKVFTINVTVTISLLSQVLCP